MEPQFIVNRMYENDAFSQWLGIRVEMVEKGSCRLSMEIRSPMLNGFGIAHGGIAYSLADSALAFAANSNGKHAMSVDTSINHFEKLTEGDVITAVAEEISIKSKFGNYQVRILKGNNLVALFNGTVYRSNTDWE